MDTSVPRYQRFKWPKIVPALDADQRRISDDFMRHWHEVLPQKYGAIEQFNHGYATRFLPDQKRFKTLELGAGIGGHLSFEDLDRQDYHCIELRQNMADAISQKYPAVKPPLVIAKIISHSLTGISIASLSFTCLNIFRDFRKRSMKSSESCDPVA